MREMIIRGEGFGVERGYSGLREHRRWEHNVKEGDVVKVLIDSADSDKKKIVTVTVVSVDYYHITLRMPAGYCRSMKWDEFANNRR